MRLSHPFFQLPILCDAPRLQAEVAALPAEAWFPHPDNLPGNSTVRLISSGGGETDSVHGQMLPTQWLSAMPYHRQVLASLGVVWGRSRLMRLAPGAGVPEHADINYHWHTRVRLHIPITTRPEVRFHCDGLSVHMGNGETWIFDNWRRHHVENTAQEERIHLVADTSGTAAFWRLACGQPLPREQWPTLVWEQSASPPLLTERNERTPVMPAAEVQLLVEDLCAELICAPDTTDARARAARFVMVMESFVFDWRQLCSLYGLNGNAQLEFLRLARRVHEAVKPLTDGLLMQGNHANVLLVLEKRVIQHLIVTDPTA